MDPGTSADTTLLDRFRFDRGGGRLFYLDGGAQVAIGSRALDVLDVLIERAGDLVLKDEIMKAVWPYSTVDDSNLTVQISSLRRVLDSGRPEASSIRTVPGRGYCFVAKITRCAVAAPFSSKAIGRRPIPRLSIVVLPFSNLSADRRQQYFADGITGDLTTDLSRIADSFVISRNTAFTYRDKPLDTKQVGRELSVRYVLEGSIQRSGKRVRVNAQLIDSETDAHIWAERIEGDTSDLFSLQDEITGRIAVSLNLALVEAEANRPTVDPDAMDYIFRARAVRSGPPTRDSVYEAVDLLERALALDPNSAEAQSWLATVLVGRVLLQTGNTDAADIARAEDLLEQALAVSPYAPRAHWIKGQLLRAQCRYAEAIPEYEAAIALDRNLPEPYGNLAHIKLLTGSLEVVKPLVERSIRLSPRDTALGYWYDLIGVTHLLQSRTDEAIIWLERARSASPARPFIHADLAAAYGIRRESERAAAELAEARRLTDNPERYSSRAGKGRFGNGMVPQVRLLYENTYELGMRRAGMPAE
jgi:TolB-like protein/Flp pilus assembly protein TadD